MESSYIGLVVLWVILIVILAIGFLMKHNDRDSDNRKQNNSEYFPYLTISKSEYFYGILLVLSLGLGCL